MTNKNDIVEFEKYRVIRNVLEAFHLKALSRTIQMKRFEDRTRLEETKVLKILLERDLDMNDVYRFIITRELAKRKRIERQKKIATILK